MLCYLLRDSESGRHTWHSLEKALLAFMIDAQLSRALRPAVRMPYSAKAAIQLEQACVVM